MKCDVCGNEMRAFHKDSTTGYKCSNCGNSWLTTFMRDIESDEKEYEILLNSSNEATADNIKLVAKIANCNFLESKKLISSSSSIAKGKAYEIQKKALELQKRKIRFTIAPEFPYSIKTGELIER